MSRPWMPFYVGDYLADTRHLATIEHGAYVLLIMHYWQTGSLPTEEVRLARISGMTPDEWAASRDTLASLFDEGWKHKRIEFELTQAARISAAGRAGGEASARARRERSLNDRSNDPPTIGQALQSQSHTQREESSHSAQARESESGAKSGRGKKTKFPDGWRPADETALARATGLSWGEIDQELQRFSNHARQEDRRCADWGAAFENWCIKSAERRGRSPPNGPATTVQRSSVFVREGTPEWAEWQDHLRATTGKGSPCKNGGWHFASERPPVVRPSAGVAAQVH